MGSAGSLRAATPVRVPPTRSFHYDARILIEAAAPLVPCSITEISEKGARLSVAAEGQLPDDFILILTQDGRLRRRCRLLWRDGLTLRVEFSAAGRS